MSDKQIEEIRARLGKARAMVVDLCNRRREWIMSIPAQPDYDPDLVISAALRDAETALQALDAEKARADVANDSMADYRHHNEVLRAQLTAANARLASAQEVISEFVYETTHLSVAEENGSHWASIPKETLENGRAWLKSTTSTEAGEGKKG